MKITRRDLDQAISHSRSIHFRIGKPESSAERMSAAIRQLESGGAAFGYGVLEGRFGPIKLGPLSADALTGVALHFLGAMGVGGEHAHNVATGLMDGYLHRLGVGIGESLRQKNMQAAPAKVGGGSPQWGISAGDDLSQAEIAAMAQGYR